MTTEEIRAQFPYLATGRIYLNHASTSPWSLSVSRRVDEFRHERLEGDIDIYRETIAVTAETRSLAGELIGTDASRVAFTQNTSEALNVLASGLDWSPGDRVLLVEREFPANIYPFLNLRRHGVEIDFLPQPNGRVRVEDLDRAITPRTRIFAVSWVQFLSGFRIDLAAVSDVCRRRGVILSLDAIQGLGAVRLDLKTTPVDFLAAGVHKWQMGPQGLGILAISENLQDRLSQAHVGWISVRDPWDFFSYALDLVPDARRYENGTYNSIGLFGYNGALHLFKDAGHDDVERRVTENAAHAWARLSEAGFEVITPGIPEERAGIVTFLHPRAEKITRALGTRKIDIAARAGHVRIAAHFYNTREEIDTAIDAIMEETRR